MKISGNLSVSVISFGKKIPVTTCKVRNNETRKFVPARLYEFDCKDEADIQEVKNLPLGWSFATTISSEMRAKKVAREKYDISTGHSFYVLKDNNYSTIGICSLKNDKDNFGVKFIETLTNGTCKYAGQAILASLALLALHDKRDKFEIRYPTDEAKDFYTSKCGFKQGDNLYHLQMDKKGMKKLVKKVQQRTHARVVDIRV